jgi:hypothetical protein
MNPHSENLGPSSIDITFDFRTDTPPGRDPDAFSPTLRRYHKLLWSKPLPCGGCFELDDTTPNSYLHHRSEAGEFFLSSDAVIPAFRKNRRISQFRDQRPVEEELEAFKKVEYTIGGMMVFPGNRIEGKQTINGARGFHPRIKDRFDLTLECIRRLYRGEHSPLSDTLVRYADFFGLFCDFRGYVEFFLLQDFVTDDCSTVSVMLPFEDFNTSPVPTSVGAYVAYLRLAVKLTKARNQRILARESDC